MEVKENDIPKVLAYVEVGTNIQINLAPLLLPVLLQHVKIYMTLQEMVVVFLGRDLPDKLGFNFKKYFAYSFSKLIHISSSSENDSDTKYILAYSGVTHGDTGGDPVSRPIYLNEKFGDDDPREIYKILV